MDDSIFKKLHELLNSVGAKSESIQVGDSWLYGLDTYEVIDIKWGDGWCKLRNNVTQAISYVHADSLKGQGRLVVRDGKEVKGK